MQRLTVKKAQATNYRPAATNYRFLINNFQLKISFCENNLDNIKKKCQNKIEGVNDEHSTFNQRRLTSLYL